MENHDNETEIEVDSLTGEDETLTAPAVEPTAEEQEEHDASFGSEDSDSAELIDDANPETEAILDSVEEKVQELENTPASEEPLNFDSIVEAVAKKVLETIAGAQDEAKASIQNQADANNQEEEEEEESKKEEVLKDSTFCGPDRTYPVVDAEHAVSVLSRAEQHASPALYRKIEECISKKSDEQGWGLPSCERDSEWSSELKQEALNKEALIMGWENNSSQELKTDYTNALLRVEDLEKQLSQALNYLNSKVNKEISLQKEDPRLADMVEWFDSIKKDDTNVQSNEVKTVKMIENPSITTADDTSSPRESVGSKKLGAFEKKVVETYSKLLEKDGLNFAENYLKSKRRYLRRGFHPKNYIQLGD